MQLEKIYKELPEHIFFIYTTICDKHYIVINHILDDTEKQLFKEVGLFLYEHNSKDLIFHKDFYISPEWAQLFEIYINKKAKLSNEIFALAQAKLCSLRNEQFV